MVYRLILPQWAKDSMPHLPKVLEGEFTTERVLQENTENFYNAYFLPNHPSQYPGRTVDGADIDTFTCVYVDMDLKEGKHVSKAAFIATLDRFLRPSKVVDSGNGVHVYWNVKDLDALSFLRINRRLCRLLSTDEAVCKIFQLMRVPGTLNNKDPDAPKLCEEVASAPVEYTCDELNAALPPISPEDEAYCISHYEKTYNLVKAPSISLDVPPKFLALLRNNAEVKNLYAGNVDDRSKADYRLGHIMFANGFTKDEALSVLANTAKASSRSSIHRVNYASGIVDKIWTFELEGNTQDELSQSVRDILSKGEDTIKGTRFPCYRYLDATLHGFRLGQVIGLVAGSGVGKTAMALNMFMGFVESNPDYVHFFVPLEQPANEIADRWRTMCGTNTALHDKVHVISNYAPDGSFRHLSLDDLKEYILKFQKDKGKKAGCVVIDHIGALKKQTKDGENQGLMDICHAMKAFAVQTNTLLVMQSQAPREKAGIGDLELNKDAAYGTVYFESYCDYLISIWQPLKRTYQQPGCPTVTAFKFCKIRHKKAGADEIMEDVAYKLFFDPSTERFREMTQQEDKSFDFFATQCLNIRKKDRKTDLVSYGKIDWVGDGKANNN